MGFNPLDATPNGIAMGVIGWAWSIIMNIAASRLPGWRCILIVFGLLFPMTVTIMTGKQPSDNKSSMLGAYYGFYSY